MKEKKRLCEHEINFRFIVAIKCLTPFVQKKTYEEIEFVRTNSS